MYYDAHFAGLPKVKPIAFMPGRLDRVLLECTESTLNYPKGCQFIGCTADLFLHMRMRRGIDTIHLSGRPDLSQLKEYQP